MSAKHSGIRTSFQSRKKNVFVSVFFLLVSLGMIGLAPVPWINATYAIDYVLSVGLALGGLFGLLMSGIGILTWYRPVVLEFTTEGVQLGRRENPLLLPWTAIESMHFTDRWPDGSKMPWRQLPDPSGLRIRWLVAYPAGSVGNPRQGRWNALWNGGRWQLCAVHTMNGEEDELSAAITATAPGTVRLEADPIEIRGKS